MISGIYSYPAEYRSSRPLLFLIWTSFIAGAGLRLAASFGDLWLDEILSIGIVRNSSSVWEIITNPSDNNHLLNSLWITWLDRLQVESGYRILAVISGLLSLLTVPYLPFLDSPLKKAIGSVLFSFSYMFVLYSSEARGYGPVVLFSLMALCLWNSEEGQPSLSRCSAFALVCLLATLSHLTFLNLYAAILAAGFIGVIFWPNPGERLADILKLHLLPIVCIGIIVGVRAVSEGSGDLHSFLDTIISAVSISVGGPQVSAFDLRSGSIALLLCVCSLMVVLLEIYFLLRENPRWAILFVSGVFVFPALSILVFEPRVLYERYLLLSALLFLLVLASFLSRISKASKFGKVLAASLMAAFVCGGLRYSAEILRYGRGDYTAALKYIISRSSAGPIVIASDHDFRNKAIIDFYKGRISGGERLEYLSAALQSSREMEWYLMHSQDGYFTPPNNITLSGRTLTLQAEFPSGALSGWRWILYR